jgi:hypothetical protein
MSDKSDTIDQLEAGYRAFREKIAALPDAAYGEVWLGHWNLSQLLAHMSGWYREMAGAMERVGRGERPAPQGVDYADPEPWNARFSSQAREGRDALADWDAAYSDYRAAAESLPEELFGTDPEKGRPRIGNRLLEASGTGHFEEHRPELDAWVASRAR